LEVQELPDFTVKAKIKFCFCLKSFAGVCTYVDGFFANIPTAFAFYACLFANGANAGPKKFSFSMCLMAFPAEE